jgi:hypothetical protein
MSYDFEYYSGEMLSIPVKPAKPRLERNPTSIEARAYADALEEYEHESKAYTSNLGLYTSDKMNLMREFQEKLKFDYVLSDSQFSVLWNEAYNRGHSGGLSEVYHEFDSLYEFVEKYPKVVK